MTKAIIEPVAGGRCYSEQQDGTDCPWGQIIAWEPPHRLVLAWQITHEWGYEPDLAKSSEVEIRFAPLPDGSTRVDLEHRHFERMGPSGQTMKTAVEAPSGWTFSGETDGLVTRKPVAGSACSTSRKNSAAPRING